jgi:hypothetical protein
MVIGTIGCCHQPWAPLNSGRVPVWAACLIDLVDPKSVSPPQDRKSDEKSGSGTVSGRARGIINENETPSSSPSTNTIHWSPKSVAEAELNSNRSSNRSINK